ncbi:hypothetical protein [Photorhabdus viridis]|uniref:hypothetical protein n=1 Tax=Photorhabdus viridis TaxID=3163327 RepID=UPI0033076CC5
MGITDYPLPHHERREYRNLDYFSRLKSQRVGFTFTNGDELTVSHLGISMTLFKKQGN